MFDDFTAAPDTTYYYWVQARNAFGDSGLSSPAPGRRGEPSTSADPAWRRYR